MADYEAERKMLQYFDDKEKPAIEEELRRLHRLYAERDKQYETAKLRRVLVVVAVFAITFFLIFWFVSDKSLRGLDVLYAAGSAIVLSGLHVWINGAIFGYLSVKGGEEAEALAFLKRQMSYLEKLLQDNR